MKDVWIAIFQVRNVPKMFFTPRDNASMDAMGGHLDSRSKLKSTRLSEITAMLKIELGQLYVSRN